LFHIGVHPFTLFRGAAFFDRHVTQVTSAALFNRLPHNSLVGFRLFADTFPCPGRWGKSLLHDAGAIAPDSKWVGAFVRACHRTHSGTKREKFLETNKTHNSGAP
jgi:hypothetical protein